MGNIIEDIYHNIKEKNKKKDLPAYVWVPSYLTCSKTIVGNPAPDITVKSRYALTEIDSSYYTVFKIDESLKNE